MHTNSKKRPMKQEQREQNLKNRVQMVVNPLKTDALTSWREMFLRRHLTRHKRTRFQINLHLTKQIIELFLLGHKEDEVREGSSGLKL